MAYVKKSGTRFQVRQGNTNVLLSSFSSPKKAKAEVTKLHKTNNPKTANRGKNAARKFK